MGLLAAIRQLLGADKHPELVDYPDEVRTLEVAQLQVHTAHITPDTKDIIVIVTLDAGAMSQLPLIDEPLRMTCADERPVTWVPVEHEAAPALDPTLGWIIPLTPATRDELRALAPGTTEVELTMLNLGIVVDTPRG